MQNFKKIAAFCAVLFAAVIILSPAAKATCQTDCETDNAGDAAAIDACIDDCPGATSLEDNIWGGAAGDASNVRELLGTDGVGLGSKDPREMIASIIKVVLGFLGIVAVVIILIGGFKWMTAGGNEDQVGEAKKWIYSGVIGLLIILSAYALASWVLTQLTTKIV